MIKVFKDNLELRCYSSVFNFTAVVADSNAYSSQPYCYQNIIYVGNFRYYGALETYHGIADRKKISKFYSRNP